MRRTIKSLWRFIGARTARWRTSRQTKQPSSASLSSSTYQDIHSFPLSRWIDLTVDGYDGAVVKSGNPSPLEIAAAIHSLRVQYADAVGDHEYRLYCNLIKEITDAEITLKQITSLVDTLRGVYNPVLARALNKLLRVSFVFDVNNAEAYDRDLDRALKRSRALKISIDLRRASLDAIEKKHRETGATPSREYFSSVLITLEDDAGFPLNPDSLTVWQFCERLRRYNKKSEQLKTQKHGR